jgi:hypothetical protein
MHKHAAGWQSGVMGGVRPTERGRGARHARAAAQVAQPGLALGLRARSQQPALPARRHRERVRAAVAPGARRLRNKPRTVLHPSWRASPTKCCKDSAAEGWSARFFCAHTRPHQRTSKGLCLHVLTA